MRWFADEDVDRPIVDHLRERGEEVWSASEECPGAPDDAVLRLAGQHSAILITADKDFGELVFRQKRVPFGVVLLRIAGLPLAAKADLVAKAIEIHGAEFPGSFTVITPKAVRIRPVSE